MSEIPKAYEPQSVEEKWYQFWLAGKFFVANEKSTKPAYSIVIPPPNVTGMLHMGHVLNNTIQDILSRKARMDGKEVLWLPGTDHAGIATQTMVEKQLKKEEKKSRTILAARNFFSASGSGRKSTATSSSTSSKNSVAPAIGRVNGSRWTRIFALRAEGVRRALQKRPDLSRQTHGELVSRVADRVVRRGSGNESAERFPVSFQGARWPKRPEPG